LVTAFKRLVINDKVTYDYNYQRNSRKSEEIEDIKKNKDRITDNFKLICWGLVLLIFILFTLKRTGCINIDSVDFAFIGSIVGLILIPYASKLKILGVEFELLTKK
jgi:hypothetical protein